MVRLRRTSPEQPGWTRRRAGRGFVYRDQDGRPLPPEDVERVRALVIPPAWTDVWITPYANGHLQAVGTDAAGRRQYLYHPDWRTRRDAEKFDRVLEFGRALGTARQRILADLRREGMPRERACAVAVRLMDLGYFRIGNDVYLDAHGSFGLTTLQRQHVRRVQERLVFADLREGAHGFWGRFVRSFAFNGTEAAVRTLLLWWIVERAVPHPELVQAVLILVAFVVRFVFQAQVVYRPRGSARARARAGEHAEP